MLSISRWRTNVSHLESKMSGKYAVSRAENNFLSFFTVVVSAQTHYSSILFFFLMCIYFSSLFRC